MERLILRNLQLQVHADVDDDAHRPEPLRLQLAQQVVGVLHVAELGHESRRRVPQMERNRIRARLSEIALQLAQAAF